MKSTGPLLVRLGLFAAAMLLLIGAVFATINRPVAGETDTYTAEFTDANGLREGDDVRLYGVRVGKVASTELRGAHALVKFSMERSHPVFENTKLAIRYQNLTGQRYLDVQQPEKPKGTRSSKDEIGTDNTIPAFDITTLFNGLQPVLAELTPDDLNQFATSLLAVVEGDGTQVGSALAAIQKVSDHYTKDRQSVVSTLVGNLAAVSDHLGGKSGNAMALLTQLADIFINLQENAVGLIDFILTAPPVINPVRHLLGTIGLDKDPNPGLDERIRTAIPNPQQVVDVLNQVPAMLQSLSAMIPTNVEGVSPDCSHGSAEAPQPLQVLIAGQRISLCNR